MIMNKEELIKLHETLTKAYAELLEDGCQDPRILKEVREFLSDNSIFADNIVNPESNQVIELELEGELLDRYKVN